MKFRGSFYYRRKIGPPYCLSLARVSQFHLYFQISATAKQLDSVTTVMNELEEKEQVYQTAINNVEKEINLRQQALELHRKKALEYAQTASELKLNLGMHDNTVDLA